MRFQISNDIQHNIGGGRNLDFRGNEDIEEVIMKLSASGANIRRSPVRDTNPREQKSDKHADDSKNKSSKESGPAKLKDGNKTHIPKGFQPIVMPETFWALPLRSVFRLFLDRKAKTEMDTAPH
ncbi:unnamed protein product [Heligmosomoides polygyrus]|uniref:Ovule protein n=1 Tax=Heligmosomoides polygyrus TaxID=6339 RepID=A0A183GS89_HELPZ|nr:unnamed protein product [Heligmosomoides polygyrus]